MDKLKSIQAKARTLARSGEFYGWVPIKFELRFEDGYAEAREWLNSPATWEELDGLCQKARHRPKHRAVASANNSSQTGVDN
jgi:hypothetical protein